MEAKSLRFAFCVVSERILARDPLEEIRRAFQLFDDDNTGKISLRNLKRVAKDLGERLDDEELYVFLLFGFLFVLTGFQASYD